MTSVTLRNTPSVVTTSSPGSTGMAGTYNGYTPVQGDTLVALVAGASTNSSLAATALHSGTTGWVKQLEIFNTGPPCSVLVAMWTRWAQGSDAAPTFTASNAGGSSAGAVVVAVLGSTSPASWDGTGNYASGSSSAAISSVTVATSSSIATTGDYVLAGVGRQRAAETVSYASAAWTNLAATTASSILAFAADGLSNPSTGAAASDTGTWTAASATSAFAAALAVAFKPYTAAGGYGGFFEFL